MVATPHALQQSLSRAGVPLVDFLATNGFPGNNSVNVPELFGNLVKDECFAVPIGGLLLYVKRIYNVQRKRQELECISLTPAIHVHTRTKSFAKTIGATKIASNSAFPQWFNDETE